jgi:hypothetical protein
MRRVLAAVATAAVLVSMLPAAVGAAPVTKFVDHVVFAECFGEVEGEQVIFATAQQSDEFGPGGFYEAWLGGAIPFEDPATQSGAVVDLAVVESDPEVSLSATYSVFDAEGNDIGTATLVATFERDGEPFVEETFPSVNRHIDTTIIHQPLVGTGELTAPEGLSGTLECVGEIIDFDVHESNPSSTVFEDEGISVECIWEFDGGFAAVFVRDDQFGFRADAFLETAELFVVSSAQAVGGLTTTSLSATMPLIDEVTGDPYTATVTADLEPLGEPVTSILVSENGREKLVEQALTIDGSVSFTTGHQFTLDDDACDSVQFAARGQQSAAKGPKGGKAPVNDAPDNAIALQPGRSLSTQTTGAVFEPEAPTTTCPEFDDQMGHTVWYTFEGTGNEVTIDTSGSNFDTMVAVYVLDGDDLVEVACIDDVIGDPVGVSYQAVLTLPTDEGVTYLVQVGGFRDFFEEAAESGRLRIVLN